MVDAHDYFAGRMSYYAREEELTHARYRFAVNISIQHGGLNVGDFGDLLPAQIWLASNMASDLHVHHDRHNV